MFRKLFICYSSWCGLGFVRGVNHYGYRRETYEAKEPYLYTNSFIYGAYGTIMYAAPLFLPFTIYKEIYRLEVNIRKLEDEKKDRYYNEVL